MERFKIKKTMVENSKGRMVEAWAVIDPKDDYIFDVFDRKRDAKWWVEQALIVSCN